MQSIYLLVCNDKVWIDTIKLDAAACYFSKKITRIINSNALWKSDIDDFNEICNFVAAKINKYYPEYIDYSFWLYHGKDFLLGENCVSIDPWANLENLVLLVENNSFIAIDELNSNEDALADE